MPHGRWQKSPQWGPSAQNRAHFVRKYDNGASTLELKWHVEPQIGTRSAIRASIQASKKDRRAAERPHCAIFCHTRPFMPQQTSQNTITSQRGPFVSQAHGPWPMDRSVMTLRSNSPMVPLATIALRSHSTRAQVQSCPISLGISPSPTLRINLACLGRKKSARHKKATQLGGFQVSMVSEAGFEPARPVCGH